VSYCRLRDLSIFNRARVPRIDAVWCVRVLQRARVLYKRDCVAAVPRERDREEEKREREREREKIERERV